MKQLYYLIEYKTGKPVLTTEPNRTEPNVIHVTPWIHEEPEQLIPHVSVDAIATIAINVVGVVARHLVSLGRRDMYAIDNAIRLTYVRMYCGMTPIDAVRRIDNHDCADMVDTAIVAIYAHVLDTTDTGYYEKIVKPAYKAVNALVWAERKQAHVNMDNVVMSYDIDSQSYIDVGISQWLINARQGNIRGSTAQKVKTLTPIQYSVLWDLCHGLSYRAIAVKRDRSLATIQSHVQALRRVFDHMTTTNS